MPGSPLDCQSPWKLRLSRPGWSWGSRRAGTRAGPPAGASRPLLGLGLQRLFAPSPGRRWPQSSCSGLRRGCRASLRQGVCHGHQDSESARGAGRTPSSRGFQIWAPRMREAQKGVVLRAEAPCSKRKAGRPLLSGASRRPGRAGQRPRDTCFPANRRCPGRRTRCACSHRPHRVTARAEQAAVTHAQPCALPPLSLRDLSTPPPPHPCCIRHQGARLCLACALQGGTSWGGGVPELGSHDTPRLDMLLSRTLVQSSPHTRPGGLWCALSNRLGKQTIY